MPTMDSSDPPVSSEALAIPSRKTLVVIPTLMLDASFSAPLAWMFSRHVNQVEGIYGFELTTEKVRQHERFIVQLNWFIELHEFGLLLNFIRTHNPRAQILFGGMCSSIYADEIFRRFPVDFTIQGDNELPIQRYLDGIPPRAIPNFRGREFVNPIEYVFAEEDYLDLELNLDWFPSHFRYRDPADLFLAPHIITAKGGCNVVHDGCGHCMGAQHEYLRQTFGRPPIAMSARSLLHLLHSTEKRFKQASLYITNANDYEFTGHRFDLEVTIEIDSPVSYRQVKDILHAFPKVFLMLPVYDEGIGGKSMLGAGRYADLIELEDSDHLIRFYVFRKDARTANIPRSHIIYADLAFPKAAAWDFYTNIDAATEVSRRFYATCERHFVDGVPKLEGKNPSYYLQNVRFAGDFR